MTKTYSKEMTAELAGDHVVASVANGRLRRRRATIDLSAQASGVLIVDIVTAGV